MGLGTVAYQLFTGQPPLLAAQLRNNPEVLETEPRRPCAFEPCVDRDLETVCIKSWKEPAKRYDSAKSLAEDLERFPARRTDSLAACFAFPSASGAGASGSQSLPL